MNKEERQAREREAMRRLILETAGKLVYEEGIEKLSIRKIAERMEYSPGIIYHYFNGKEDIVGHLLQEGYSKMIAGLKPASQQPGEKLWPEEMLTRSLSQFIRLALTEELQYRNIMLNNSAAVLSHTAVLHSGAAEERKAINMLCTTLSRFERKETYTPAELELTAQIIWSAAFGLIVRLTVENPPKEQREALIARHLQAMVLIAKG